MFSMRLFQIAPFLLMLTACATNENTARNKATNGISQNTLSGPTATLLIDIKNVGDADIQVWEDAKHCKKNVANAYFSRNAESERLLTVPAGEPIALTVGYVHTGVNTSSTCHVALSFTAQPGKTYKPEFFYLEKGCKANVLEQVGKDKDASFVSFKTEQRKYKSPFFSSRGMCE